MTKRGAHVSRRLAELRKFQPSFPSKQRVRRGAPIKMTRSDADSLRHIAERIRGTTPNFAAELERIAAAAMLAAVPSSTMNPVEQATMTALEDATLRLMVFVEQLQDGIPPEWHVGDRAIKALWALRRTETHTG